MLDVLKYRQDRDNDVCKTCGSREPGGLYPHNTGWYCQICLQRLETTQAKLQGYETPSTPVGYLWPGKPHMFHTDTSTSTSHPAPGYPAPQPATRTPQTQPATRRRR